MMNDTRGLTVGDLIDSLGPIDRSTPVFVGAIADTTYRHTYLPSLLPVVKAATGIYRDTRPGEEHTDVGVFLGSVE